MLGGAVSAEANIGAVEQWLRAFDRRFPDAAELAAMVTPDVRFVERPNLLNPGGSERDLAGIVTGLEAGRAILAWQAYDVIDHVASADVVVARFRWSGELAITVGTWPAGTTLAAWCVGHYTIRDGRLARIEQHDCYEPARLPREH
jgi:hypothetical protein